MIRARVCVWRGASGVPVHRPGPQAHRNQLRPEPSHRRLAHRRQPMTVTAGACAAGCLAEADQRTSATAYDTAGRKIREPLTGGVGTSVSQHQWPPAPSAVPSPESSPRLAGATKRRCPSSRSSPGRPP